MISPLVSLMVDQVCSLHACGICAAILSGNTGVNETLLALERDVDIRLLFTAPEAIVGNSSCIIVVESYTRIRILSLRTFSVNEYMVVGHL